MKGSSYRPPCPTPGCGRPRHRNRFARWGVQSHCSRCCQRIRRHGEVDQRAVLQREWRKVATRLRRLVQRGGKADRVELAFRQIASNLAEVTVDDLRQPSQNGKARVWVPRWQAQALDEVQRVLGDTDPIASGYLICAMFVLREADSRRFASDRGFNFELVRMWRKQTRLAYGSWYNPETDTVRGYWKDLPPRVVEYVAELLLVAYSRVAGLALGAVRKERERQAALRDNLNEGFAPLLAD